MCTKSVASNWVFRFSRWVGATPFNYRGQSTRFQAMYFTVTMIFVLISNVGMRYYDYKLSHTFWSQNLYLLRRVAFAFSQFSMASALVFHLFRCRTKSKELETVLKGLNHQNTNYWDRLMLVIGITANFGFILWAIAQIAIYQMFEIIPFLPPYYLTQHIIITTSNFYNFVAIIQYESIIEEINFKLEICKRDPIRKLKNHSNLLKLTEKSLGLFTRPILMTVLQISCYTVVFTYMIMCPIFNKAECYVRPGMIFMLGWLIFLRLITLSIIVGVPHRFIRNVSPLG